MAPRETRNGAPATTRRKAQSGRQRAASNARTPATCDASVGRWWVAPVVSVAIAAVFLFTYYPVARVQYRETKDKVKLEAELALLEERNTRLTKQVNRLRTPEGVEDYARSRLGLVKEGENVVVVQGLPDSLETTSRPGPPVIDSGRTEVEDGQWTEFLDFIFGVQ